jgi:hypothetical protein
MDYAGLIAYLKGRTTYYEEQRTALMHKDHWNDFDWKWDAECVRTINSLYGWVRDLEKIQALRSDDPPEDLKG